MMSADNFVLIRKDKGKHKVSHRNASTDSILGKEKVLDTLEEAVVYSQCVMAELEMDGIEVEYGIVFEGYDGG